MVRKSPKQAEKRNIFDVETLLNIYCISKCIMFVNVNYSIYSKKKRAWQLSFENIEEEEDGKNEKLSSSPRVIENL